MKRSNWKGPFLKKLDLSKKLLLLPRNTQITSQIVGVIGTVYSGKTFVNLSIIDEMIGHKIGEFISTREKFSLKKNKK